VPLRTFAAAISFSFFETYGELPIKLFSFSSRRRFVSSSLVHFLLLSPGPDVPCDPFFLPLCGFVRARLVATRFFRPLSILSILSSECPLLPNFPFRYLTPPAALFSKNQLPSNVGYILELFRSPANQNEITFFWYNLSSMRNLPSRLYSRRD